MKKVILLIMLFAIGTSIMAQQKIQLRSTDRAECVKSDMKSLQATFSFSTFEAENLNTKGGEFSWLSMPNTVIGGNEGEPQIPVINELIAVPFGAQPTITVKSFSTTDYKLNDIGIKTLIPRQPSLKKTQKPEDVPFVYNEAAYQTRGLRSEPQAFVNIAGIMRGVQLGKMTIEPVSYDPVNNTLRVFNDIEVEINFDGADAAVTEKMLIDTYSPYFEIVYKQLFNNRAVLDAYTQHPDLYTTPVKMLVVTTSTYATSTAFQNWLTWKKQKGIDVDVQTVTNNASATTIKNTIYSRYNANHPSFLVIVGDETVVTYYSLWDYGSSYGNAATDLEYASVDGDVYHDMFISRMPVSSTTELNNLVNKILMYEQYTMPDPSYLNESLLIAGWDEQATAYIGKPTIQYANNYYFNSAHGITPHVFLTTASGQTTCYNYINQVGFVNYTAHGDIQKWHDPQFLNSDVNNLTNTNKYFWAIGNCCLTANFKNSQNSQVCFGETMVRAANKGAFGYIGSVPESLWYEDYYFGVGATNTFAQMPTQAQTSTGIYDAMFDDTGFNTLNSVPYIGNVAVTYAHAGGYQSSVDDEYYWRAYQCFGDGSVMPYLKVPASNNVSHASTIKIGVNFFTVNADAGSYVAITRNNEILGAAQVSSTGSVNVPITPLTSLGNVMIVVTRNQRQPYINTIQAVSNTQYNITCNQPQHGNISVSSQAYAGTLVTLTATPETSYCLSGWTVTDANNNPITVTDNQFVMPSSAVTVTATFVPGLKVSLASVMHGSISADSEYVLQGKTINLTATPASNYVFDSWVVYKTGDVNTTVTVNNNSFTMPSYPVTVSAIFNEVVNDNVTIGSGTTTNNGQYLPTYAYYKYSLTQQIYTSSEVGSAGTITKIAFEVSNSKSAARNVDIYLSHTSNSSFSGNSAWVSQSTSYRVFSGVVSFASSGWTTITLDTPFEYNGTSNLLLTVDDNTGSYVSSSSDSPKFYTYSGSSNTAIYKYNDNTNYNPASMSTSGSRIANKNQVIFTKQLPSTEGYLSVSSTNLTGFSTMAGTASEAQSIAVIGSNLQANLTVSAPTGFELSSSQNGSYNSSLTLTPSNGNVRANVFVRLSASASEGEHNGNLTLTSSTTSATVSLNGEVLPATATQTVTLSQGWNWWVPTAGITLADLKAALGSNGVTISSQNAGFLQYANGVWTGTLENLVPGQMYKIQASTNCNITLTGTALSSVTITIHKGFTWFGFTGDNETNIAQALTGFTPAEGDMITSYHDGFTQYIGGKWVGTLEKLTPGNGYVYYSNDNNDKELTFSR